MMSVSLHGVLTMSALEATILQAQITFISLVGGMLLGELLGTLHDRLREGPPRLRRRIEEQQREIGRLSRRIERLEERRAIR